MNPPLGSDLILTGGGRRLTGVQPLSKHHRYPDHFAVVAGESGQMSREQLIDEILAKDFFLDKDFQ